MMYRLLILCLLTLAVALPAQSQAIADLELSMTALEETGERRHTIAMTVTNLGPNALDGTSLVRVRSTNWLWGKFAQSLDGACDVEVYSTAYIPHGGGPISLVHFLAYPELQPNQSLTCFAEMDGVGIQRWRLTSGGVVDPVADNNGVEDLLYSGDPSDRGGLLRFFYATNGNHWFDNSGWGSNQSVCDWYGVSCTGEQVIGLDLSDNNLSGSLPEELLWVSGLQTLDLSRNQLTGSIPRFWELLSLRQLDLSRNQLSSTIPGWVAREPLLEEVDLSRNRLTGLLPDQFQSDGSLKRIDLSSNKLYGFFPDTLAAANGLESLNLEGNFLIGSLPGTLPDSIVSVSLADNWLSGSIPFSWGNLASLGLLDLRGNRLSGGLPGSLARAGELAYLDVSYNQLSQRVPAAFGRSQSLEYLGLAHNRIRSALPRTLDNADGILIDVEAAVLPGPVDFRIDPEQAVACTGERAAVSLDWQVEGIPQVEIRRDAPDGVRLRSGSASGSLTTGQWVRNGTRFHLVDAANGQSLADLEARVTKAGCENQAIEIVPRLAATCAPESRSRVRVEWNAIGLGVEEVELRVHAPHGTRLASGGAVGFAETGFWVGDQTEFFLLDAGNGQVIDSARARVDILRCN